MAKLERKLQKIFGETAGTDGKTTFGSIAQTGQAVFSEDVEQLQTAAYSTGWRGAVKEVAGKGKAPILTDLNTINYVSSYQIKYLQQMGVAEWLGTETYYLNSLCLYNGLLYKSLQDNNINHNPTVDTTYWVEYTSKILPIWRSDITYNKNEKVSFVFNGYYYEFISLIDNNLNNSPEPNNRANTNWWRIYPVVVMYWNQARTYADGDKISYKINNIYYEYLSLQNNNLGHTPPDSQGDEWWYRVVAPQTQFSLFTNVVDLGQVSSYTAPADGYFMVNGGLLPPAGSSSSFIIRINNVIVIQKDVAGTGSETLDTLGVYVKKGAVIACSWSGQVRTITCSFAYTN